MANVISSYGGTKHTHTGHYVCDIYSSARGRWSQYNHRVSCASEVDVLGLGDSPQKDGYLFLYMHKQPTLAFACECIFYVLDNLS